MREARLLDLGALVYELHRQGKRAPELLQEKAAELSLIDDEVRQLEEALEGAPAEAEAEPPELEPEPDLDEDAEADEDAPEEVEQPTQDVEQPTEEGDALDADPLAHHEAEERA